MQKGGFDQAIGRSRGGLTTKIHVIVDALGNPLALSLNGGQVHDISQAETLTAQVQPEALLGDKGYDAGSFIESLECARSSRSSHRNQIARSNAIATTPCGRNFGR
jgi:transposase